MLNRRHFLTSSIATATVVASPALSHSAKPYVIPEEYMPAEVTLQTQLAPGELHVDPNTFRLYWTLPDNRAIRYTVGVGRANLYHAGEFYVGAKREWPSWTPTPEMIKRDPDSYEKYADGVPGGVDNPLGSMALYLYTSAKRDSYLRIHGTSQPWTIGRAVSNGCARLVNEQATELYNMVPLGTRVILNEKSINTA